MIPGQFEYVRPGSVPDTLRLLRDREGEAKVISGGYSLIPMLKLRLAQPTLLVDIRDVAGLDGLRERVTAVGGSLQIHSRPGHGTVVHTTIPLQEAH